MRGLNSLSAVSLRHLSRTEFWLSSFNRNFQHKKRKQFSLCYKALVNRALKYAAKTFLNHRQLGVRMGLPPLTVPAQLTGRRSGTVLRAQTPPSPGSPSRERARAFRTKLTAHDAPHDETTPESPTSVLQPQVAPRVVEELAPGDDEGSSDSRTSARAEPSDAQVSEGSVRVGVNAPRRNRRWNLWGAAVLLTVAALRLRPGA
ncbi:hypothetical protein BSKO_03384 [Bryopsis sp. KO-2023]|nr:hypothetical protein BSKO_03384 [Bryopsis sp. KO-2023]